YKEVKSRHGEDYCSSDPPQIQAGYKQQHSANNQQRDGSTEIGLKNNQARKNGYDNGNRDQSELQIVNFAFAILQKVSKEENHSQLGQLRRLDGESGKLNPSMRIRRGSEKEHKYQHRDNDCQAGKHHSRIPIGVIVHLHHDEHHCKSERRKDQLLERKIIWVAEF